MTKTGHKGKSAEAAETSVENVAEVAEAMAGAVVQEPVSAATIEGAESGKPIDEVALLRSRVESLEDSLFRAKADYQNLQRRMAVERSEAIRYATADLMKSLLPVVDGLQQSLVSAAGAQDLVPVFEGVKMTIDTFMKTMSAHGLEIIEAKGKTFDPTVHEALMQAPSADVPPGQVLEEIMRGYRLRDRVLRAAKVVVAKAPDEKQGEKSEG